MPEKQNNPTESLRKKQKSETYALILNAAGDMFESLGYEKTTMRKIAAKVGISPGAIFKYFDNKSALLAAKLYNDIEITQNKALSTIPQKTTVQNQFLYIAECFFKYYEVRPVLSKMLVEHSLFHGGKWSEKLENQIMRLGAKIVELIQEGKLRNEIKKKVDNYTLGTALWSNYIFVLILIVNSPTISAISALEMLKPLASQTFSGAINKNYSAKELKKHEG